MRGFEYVAILFSVLLGLSMSRLLVGAARAVVDPERRLHWLPALWTVQLFVFQIVLWWLVFQRADQATWSFAHYALTVAYPVLLYFAAVLLYPDLGPEDEGTMESFLSRRRWFYALLFLLMLVDLRESAMGGGLDGGVEATVVVAAHVLVLGAAIWTRNRVYHGVLALAALAFALFTAVSQLPAIG